MRGNDRSRFATRQDPPVRSGARGLRTPGSLRDVIQSSTSPFARAVSAVPPPGLLLISIVSIQLGAAVAVDLFPVLGPVGTAFLRLAFVEGLDQKDAPPFSESVAKPGL